MNNLTKMAVWSSAIVITVFGIQPVRAEQVKTLNHLASVSVNAQDLLVQDGTRGKSR